MKNRELGLPATNGLHSDRHPIMTRAEPHRNTRQAGHVHGRILQLTVSRCCKTHRSRSMSAQFDDLPDEVRTEVQAFTDVNISWLKKTLIAAKVASPKEAEKRARAIYSGIVGAQLMARSRADVALYDSLIESYRTAGLLPA